MDDFQQLKLLWDERIELDMKKSHYGEQGCMKIAANSAGQPALTALIKAKCSD